jgi:hypothetical protein
MKTAIPMGNPEVPHGPSASDDSGQLLARETFVTVVAALCSTRLTVTAFPGLSALLSSDRLSWRPAAVVEEVVPE